MRSTFGPEILNWYQERKRALPWRETRDPYCIWLSEIMLQQTRVDTVIPYYQRFLAALPGVNALAVAKEEELLKLWEGLGYYSRVRNMQKAAKIIVSKGAENFPATYETLKKLPGIGPYTAGAIASIAFGEPVPAIDGNVLRVFSRLYEIEEDISAPATWKYVFQLVKDQIPQQNPGDFNQALMDLGAGVCKITNPACEDCPIKGHCQSYKGQSQDRYPVKMPKSPPKPVAVGVGLFIWGERVWVIKRTQRLLHGLWVFPLIEGDDSPEELLYTYLGEEGKNKGESLKHMGQAQHIFTHRIWNMNIFAFTLNSCPANLQGQWVTKDQLDLLAMPTAMKAAKKLAHELLLGQL